MSRGAWVVQWVECGTLGFGWACDLRVMGWSPEMLSGLWDQAPAPYQALSLLRTLHLPLPLPLTCDCSPK